MTLALGGPGPGCSAMRIRRLAAGELAGDDRTRTEAHLAACARCQATERELATERARLAADLPFDVLAAGVAERLARGPRSVRPRPTWRAAAGVALAAGLAVALAIPLVRDAPGGSAVRVKGAAELTVWVSDGGGAEGRALAAGEAVPRGAVLRVGLAPAGRGFAAVALLDADGVVVLHAGPARPGPLPGAFEWTGTGDGILVAVLDDAPVDAAALAARLARGGVAAAAPGARAEVVSRPLRRPAP